MSGLKCGKCGHENDPTRVFCQNCGSRLERGAEEAPVGPSITPVPVKRKSKKPGISPLAAVGQLVKGILSLAILGALIAFFIQLGRSPDGIPEAKPVDDKAATVLLDGVKAFTTSPFRRTIDIKQDQINNYLGSRLQASTSGGPTLGAQFGRAFVVLGDKSFQFYVERKYLGLSVYFRVDCDPLAGPEGATAIAKGGGIGRVPLHPAVLRLVQARVFDPALEALAEPLDLLRKANRVDIVPGEARLGWPGSTPGR